MSRRFFEEGGMIRKGFNEEIDRLRDLASGGKGKIAEIEQAEREAYRHQQKLKIGYNRVFGYYIEVSRSMRRRFRRTIFVSRRLRTASAISPRS